VRSIAPVVAGLAAGALAIAAACRPAAPPAARAPTWEELPPPSWRVVSRREGKVLLAAQRMIRRGVRRPDDRSRTGNPERARTYPTLIFEKGRLREGPAARADVRILGSGGVRDTLLVYSLEFEGRTVVFVQAGEASAQPNESPVEPGLYVVEHENRLWLIADSGVAQLTADTVPGIARDTLRSQSAEGGPHLFWAARPMWTPDGSAIAYVTNRTWMLTRPSGQEVWLAEMRSRRERPLLSERGTFFSPEGWLGAELVYTAGERGLSAVNVRTGTQRRLGLAPALAVSSRGSRLLYMTSVGDTVGAHLLTERGALDVPDPPPGERLGYGGAFSPSGARLVLQTSFARDSGMTRALYVFDVVGRRLTPLTQWSFREGSRHPHGLPVWLDDSTLLLTQFDRGTGLESSTLVRLPPPR
jgi:hypothetical protein